MVKALIFDLDNTLINWIDEYDFYAIDLLNSYGLSDENIFSKFNCAMKKYESTHIKFDKVDMSRYFSKYLNFDLGDDFVDKWTDSLKNAYPVNNDELIKLLSYLNNKYDLFVTTNWFTDQQVSRLKNMNIYKFFNKIYGCDFYDRKPYSEMMEEILKNYDSSEVVYIGDSYPIDIKFAINSNVFAYYITTNDKKKSFKFKKISSIYDLKKYL